MTLKEIRVSKKLTQQDVADKLKIKRQVISQWELGAKPSLEKVWQLSEILETSTDDIIKAILNKDQK